MKKFILFFLAGTLAISLVSCKKKYTCTCNTNYTFKNSGGGLTTIIIPAKNETYSQKMTEKQARAACRHEATTIESNFQNGITGSGYYSLQDGESIDTSCGLTL